MPRFLARLIFLPTLCWNLLLARLSPRRRWWDRIDEHVILGAMPFARHVPKLHAEGVRAVINMCDEYGGPIAEYERLGITQLRIPTVDFNPPELSKVRDGVEFIRQQAAAGNDVYVHCKAGRARSAAVVVCWLMAEKGLTPRQALESVQKKRPHVKRDLDRQAVVKEFAAQLPVAS
jgi:atypical dual specificity phosphatase